MKARLVRELPRGSQWLYEVKFDGIRALAIKDVEAVTLVSRSGNDLSCKYPQLVTALRQLAAAQAVLDGEIVALDSEGRPSFQLLQGFHHANRKPPLLFYVFDLLNLNGKNVTGLPLVKRKALAESLLNKIKSPIRFSQGFEGSASRVLRELQEQGFEGVVAKLKDSHYEPGQRSGAWAKFKWNQEQEFVIGGYTQPKGGRPYFGALLVGYYEGDRLLFAGKVGTGFDQQWLVSLYRRFQEMRRPDCPFANLPEKFSSGAKGVTAGEMRLCTWLEPTLVCQVRFAEWTHDRHLRQPAFIGLREDKKPTEVVRERAA